MAKASSVTASETRILVATVRRGCPAGGKEMRALIAARRRGSVASSALGGAERARDDGDEVDGFGALLSECVEARGARRDHRATTLGFVLIHASFGDGLCGNRHRD